MWTCRHLFLETLQDSTGAQSAVVQPDYYLPHSPHRDRKFQLAETLASIMVFAVRITQYADCHYLVKWLVQFQQPPKSCNLYAPVPSSCWLASHSRTYSITDFPLYQPGQFFCGTHFRSAHALGGNLLRLAQEILAQEALKNRHAAIVRLLIPPMLTATHMQSTR